MLDASLKEQLKTHLERVARPLNLVASLDESPASRELMALLRDIAELSDRITVGEAPSGDDRRPAFTIGAGEAVSGITFAGLPMGHEFTSLVLALLQAGGVPPKIAPDLSRRIAELEGEFRFETYFSQSCQNCPDVVQALNLMAVLNPRISHVAIDGALFPEEVEARGVMAVPAVYLNGQPFAQGRMGLEEILARIDADGAEKAARREAEAIAARAPYDVLVVGGGPAGAAAAIYAARKGIRTGIVSERFGGQVLDTLGIENFISVSHTEGPKLAAALEQHVRDYDVDIMDRQRAERLLPAAAPGGLAQVGLAGGAVLKARTVVLSPGARWRQMNVPGEEEYRNRGVAYCPHCDGPLFKGKRVAVIGGGNSGVEAAIDLAGIVAHVTLLEFDAALRADQVLQAKLRSLPNVTVLTSARTTEVLGDGKRVTGIAWQDRTTEAVRTIDLDGVFVQIGLLPNTEWLRDVVALSERGEIQVDHRGQTSLPGIFAAGDATTVPYKQIVIAMGEGSKAALAAFDHLIRTVPDEQAVAA